MPLAKGNKVSIFGLKGRPELNGLTGVIQDSAKNDRWMVALTNKRGTKEVVSLAPANLKKIVTAADKFMGFFEAAAAKKAEDAKPKPVVIEPPLPPPPPVGNLPEMSMADRGRSRSRSRSREYVEEWKPQAPKIRVNSKMGVPKDMTPIPGKDYARIERERREKHAANANAPNGMGLSTEGFANSMTPLMQARRDLGHDFFAPTASGADDRNVYAKARSDRDHKDLDSLMSNATLMVGVAPIKEEAPVFRNDDESFPAPGNSRLKGVA